MKDTNSIEYHDWQALLFAMKHLAMFMARFVVTFVIADAGRGFNPEYEADRAFRTALITSYMLEDKEIDEKEIERLLKLPRYVLTYPTGEVAKTQWIFLDEALLYAVEHDWRKGIKQKGRTIFNFTEKGSKR